MEGLNAWLLYQIMLFPIPSWLDDSRYLSWVPTEVFNLPILGLSLKKYLCLWAILFFLTYFKFGLIEGVPLDNFDYMLFLHLDNFINIDIVDSRMNFAFHELPSIILLDKSFPLFFGHRYLFWEPLFPKKSQCHIVSISNDITHSPGL